jgi:hypothetical protein
MEIHWSPESLLAQIAQIKQMEKGKLCVLRQGPEGPYYNCQSREKGKTFSRYVPREMIPAYQEAIEGYQRFCQLTEQYAQSLIERTRAQWDSSAKKKNSPKSSSWRRRPNSSRS